MEVIIEEDFKELPPYRPEPEPARVKKAVELLEKTQRPVIVAGGGVRSSGASKELIALAEKLNIPVATSLNGKDTIPGNHPLSVGVVGSYSRKSANQVVNGADLVFFVGTETGGMTTHFWAVPPIGTPAIQLGHRTRSPGAELSLTSCGSGRRQGEPAENGGRGERGIRRLGRGLGGKSARLRPGVAR